MAEVKNAFIKSKMNKNLDDRLIPNGEYRNALNVQVSKSEASDVGALENVLGNKKIEDFALLYDQKKTNQNAGSGFTFTLNDVVFLKVGMIVRATGVLKGTKITNITGNSITLDKTATIAANAILTIVFDLTCIGYFADDFNTNIYSFFTDFTDNNTNETEGYDIQSKNFIFKYSIATGNTTTLVLGNFLNFSTTKPIIGVNLLENLLFFTDNRNQPRKINVNLANSFFGDRLPTYYSSEDQISVAKYNPYECIRVFSTTDTTKSSLAGAITQSTFLTALSGTKVLAVDNATGISVGNGVTGAGVKTNTFVVSISGSNITTNKVQNLASGVTVVFAGLQTTMQDVSTATLPAVSSTVNPYFDANFGGDPDFLKDKFVRFSYRFNFSDGENSIFAPFTQPCFIPKQDGYFINDDEVLTFSSTVVGFMENKVTKIQLQIPLPATGAALYRNSNLQPYKIESLEILYKESDGLAVQVVDTIPFNEAFRDEVGLNNVYQYNYESTKPFKTLPSKDLIRVYDKIPVKAFSQEIISNRVVYGNFQDKHTPPASLDYQVSVGDKYDKNSSFSNKTVVEYPNSTVKQNRNYQVGIVLSDKFGRQSSTLLSNNTSPLTIPDKFGASTVFSPYQTAADTTPHLWPGDSLKVLFNEPILSNVNTNAGTPGLYNGDSSSSLYNPLGWYSYKVVIQQKEQDYYNVYNAGAMKGNPLDVAKDLNTSYISLLNDNINKVPRDLSEVGPLQKQFRSSVRLIGRVQNTQYATIAIGNSQFYPGNLTDTTSSIEDLNSLFDVSSFKDNSATPVLPAITSNTNAYSSFYKAESDPLIAQITTTQPFGLVNTATPSAPSTYAPIENLAVFETEPDLSRLDFYFETSTSGLISELNLDINIDRGGAQGLRDFELNQFESDGLGVAVTEFFSPTDLLGNNIINSEIPSFTVVDLTGSNNDRSSEWSLSSTGNGSAGDPNLYQLFTSTNAAFGYQYYGRDSDLLNYKFTFQVKDVALNKTNEVDNINGALQNDVPEIAGGATQTIIVAAGTTGPISTQAAVNGSNLGGGNQTLDLEWKKTSGNNIFTINDSSGIISINTVNPNDPTPAGSYEVGIQVKDAGGKVDNSTLTIIIGATAIDTRFNQNPEFIADGDMITYYYSDPLPNTQYGTLDGNNHVIADPTYRQSAAATSTPTLDSPTKTGTVCPDANHYTWLKEYKGTSFQGGNDKAFYVHIKNTQKKIGTTQSSASVEYRSNNTSNWTIAKDIDGQDAKFGMIQTVPATFAKVRYIPSTNNSNDTFTLMTLDAQRAEGNPSYLQPEDYGVTVTGTVEQGISGARIFAFNGNQGGLSSGEYRITLGNFHGTNLNYPNCAEPPKGNGEAQQKIQVGDANYGQVDQSTPASSYPYRVSKNAFSNYNSNLACGTELGTGNRPPNFVAIEFDTAYAREFIAKYVTQFYTDEGLTTKLTLTTGLHSFGRVGTQSNIESTLNGLYQAVFNSAGLRVPSLGNPSIACTLDPPGGGGGSGQPVQSIQFVLNSIVSAQGIPITLTFPGTNLENVSWNISGGGIDSSGTTFPIDFSQNTGGAIFTVFASNFSSAAKWLDMGQRGVISCDISALTNVEQVNFSSSGLFGGGGILGPIDLSGNIGLDQINIVNANMGSIDFTNNVNIRTINITGSNLTEIKGLNGKTLLECFRVQSNNITTLDLSTNTSLNAINLRNNNLSLLNIQNGNNLNWVFAGSCAGFNITNNSNLTCVTVDANAVAFANTNFTGKDSQTFYSGTTCP